MPVMRAERMAEARAYYEGAYAKGLDHLVESSRSTCPWCASPVLRRRLRSRELIQRKPGRFTLDECRTCGYIFQSPRLSPAGLDFYYRDFCYRDFYGGLGTGAYDVVSMHHYLEHTRDPRAELDALVARRDGS